MPLAFRKFYEFASWPSGDDSSKSEVAQLVAREVGALVAVRRSVADVDWIQQVQSCVSATLAKSTAQADDGGVDEEDDGMNGDGGGRQMRNGVARAASDAGFARLANSVSTILSTSGCENVERAVARWRAGLARVAQQKRQTKRERKRAGK